MTSALSNERGLVLSALDWLRDHHATKADERRSMADDLALQPDDVVLDSACGPGYWTRLFAERVRSGGKVIGLDFSPELVEAARDSFRGDPLEGTVEFVLGDFHAVPFEHAVFDAIFLGNCCCYVRDIPALLEGHKRVARRGGRVISKEFDGAAAIFHPLDPHFTLEVMVAAARGVMDAAGDQWFDNFVGRKMHGLFVKAGFRGVRTRTYAIQKVAPLTGAAKRYLTGNAGWYGRMARPHLSKEDYQRWEDAFDPESGEYILDRDDFYFCMLETVTAGTV